MTVAHSPRFAPGRRPSFGRLAALAALHLIVAPILLSPPRSAIAQSDGDNAAAAPAQAEQTEQRGHVDLRDIDLNDPTLISLLRLLSPPRDGAGAEQTVTFRRLVVDYQRSPEKLIIRDGAACHDAFAATISGYASLPAGELHFHGVIWPAYAMAQPPAAPQQPDAIASVRGLVPLLPSFSPNLFVGLTYEVVGTSEAPKLRINPFADVYPGAVRRVVQTCRRPDAGGN
jgi:hypothetical protein